MPSPEEVWLEQRRTRITGTEAGRLMGPKPDKSALAKEKLSPRQNQLESPLMFWGKKLEAANLEGFSEITGIPCKSTHEFVIYSDRIGATLDGIIECAYAPRKDHTQYIEWVTAEPRWRPEGYHALTELAQRVTARGLIEMKQSKADSKPWTKIPPYYWWQVQTQLLCTGYSQGILVHKVDMHKLRAYLIDRDDFALEALVERVDWFWDNIEGIADGKVFVGD